MSNSSEAVKRWRNSTKDRMVKAMGSKCQCCGYNTCNSSLAFHHIDPTKKDLSFADTRANPQKWIAIVEELRKCILVCNNCHGEIHAGIRVLPEEYSKFDESFLEYRPMCEYNACVCGNQKPATFKFCSHKCSAKNHRKVDWDSIDLLELMKTNTISQLEDMLGVSNAAIYKRRNKINENIIC